MPDDHPDSGTVTWCAVCRKPYDFRPTRPAARPRHRLRVSLCRPCKLEARAAILRGVAPVPALVRDVVERMNARFTDNGHGAPGAARREAR